MLLCSNPRAQYLAYKAEIDDVVARVLDRGWYILGEEVKAFEAEFAAYVGASDVIGVGSGTEALHLALAACGIGAGDEVITVSHTAVATVAAIELCGAQPVLVDIASDCLTMDPQRIREAITSRTKAIVPVHLYGHPAEIDTILELARHHGLRVIEDCAQSHGAALKGRRTGAWGDAGCFSFYPTKNLGAFGDGGAVATNDPELARKLRLLREYGWSERYVSSIPGWNSRLDELQAAVLRVKLHHLDEAISARRRVAAYYAKGLEGFGLSLPKEANGATHVYHLYVVRHRARDRLQTHLKQSGIGALIHYPLPIHLQPAYKGRLNREAALAETERAAREVLSLPMYPELMTDELDQVISAVREFARGDR